MEEKLSIDLLGLLEGSVNRIRNIKRFGNCPRINLESVAEHQYFTAFYTMIIGQFLVDKGFKLDLLEAIKKALMHDIEEGMTGDLVRPAKIKIKHLLHEVSKEFCKEILSEISQDQKKVNDWLVLWERAKDLKTNEGVLVAFSDYLSVLSYLYREVNMGNKMIKQNLSQLLKYADKFRNEKVFRILDPFPEKAYQLAFAIANYY